MRVRIAFHFVTHYERRKIFMYEENVRKQNSFSRSMANDEKLGAYYTDKNVCAMIGRYLAFPEAHVNVLEPSVGDSSALFTLLYSAAQAGAEKAENTPLNNDNVQGIANEVKSMLNTTTYAVELNPDTYQKLKEKEIIDYLINEDFLTGMKVTNKGFTFCFSNPPYGMNPLGKERFEVTFLQRISACVKPGGVLVYVIPEYVIKDEKKFRKEWTSRFVTAGIYRFPEKVYQQFKQCVLFGVRKNTIHTYEEELEDYDTRVANMEQIHENYEGEKLRVPASEEKEVKFFTTYEEDPVKNIKCLHESPVFKNLRLEEKRYTNTKIGNPIVPLKEDLLYLLAVSGCGQGLAGSKETRDLHLQRGNVKRVENTRYEPNGDGLKAIVTETSSVCMTILENDGTITRL